MVLFKSYVDAMILNGHITVNLDGTSKIHSKLHRPLRPNITPNLSDVNYPNIL